MEERYRILALDFGTKRIGVAISDELRMLASVRGTIEQGKAAIAEIIDLAKKNNIRQVILGLPTTLRNQASEMTGKVMAFGDKLRVELAKLDIELSLRDERLTSVMANSNIATSGMPKKKREQAALRDDEAARILLQEFLDLTRGL